MNKDAKIYRMDYLDDENHLHHKFYVCLNEQTAMEQFKAGCDHKHICTTKVTVFKCEQGCNKWEKVS